MSILSGLPQGFSLPLFETEADRQANLGALAYDPNGDQYVYVKAGAVALVPGKLQQSPAVVTDHLNIAVAAAAAVGATQVTVTLGATAATADQYAGGVMAVTDATGEGYTYRIKSHPAAALSASLVLTLEDPIDFALTTSSEVSLIANKYNGVIVNPTAATGIPVGVALYVIAIGEYGWIKKKGVTAVLNDGAPAVGTFVAASNAVAGAVEGFTGVQAPVGITRQAGVDTEYRTVEIDL